MESVSIRSRLTDSWSRFFDHIGMILLISGGFYLLIADPNSESQLISIISMNFTVGSLVLAILSLEDSIDENGKIYLEWSSKFLISSSILLFYVLADFVGFTKNPVFSEIIQTIIRVLTSVLFTFGIYFLVLATFKINKSSKGLIEAYAEDCPLSPENTEAKASTPN